MATKSKTKKETPKINESEEKEVVKKIDEQKSTSFAKDVKKEEIKEIVEETVEEVLKKESQEKDESVSSVPQPAPEETTPERNENPSEASSLTQENTVPVSLESTPTQLDEKKEHENTLSQEENKQEEVESPGAPTSPVSNPVLSQPLGYVAEDMPTPSKKSSALLLFIFFLILGIAAGAVLLWFATTRNMLPFNKLSLPSVFHPTPTPTVVPTSTPTAQVDLSKYTIEVLNGSGVTGAAAKAKDALSAAGFNVQGTDNADSSDFTQTTIQAKSSVDSLYIAQLMKTLEASYVVSQSAATLSDSSSTDVVVTIGSSIK